MTMTIKTSAAGDILDLEQLTTYGTLVYTPSGKVSHLILSELVESQPLCLRYSPSLTEWRGTGSQQEYETAASRPMCRDCWPLIPHHLKKGSLSR